MAEDAPIFAFTENVIILERKGKAIGFIKNAVVYNCEKSLNDDVARLIDGQFGVIARKRETNDENKGGG